MATTAEEIKNNIDPKEKLYKVLKERGLYSKTYDEFKDVYSNEENIDVLHKVVTKEGLYSKDTNTFKQQYFREGLKKKEPTTEGQQPPHQEKPPRETEELFAGGLMRSFSEWVDGFFVEEQPKEEKEEKNAPVAEESPSDQENKDILGTLLNDKLGLFKTPSNTPEATPINNIATVEDDDKESIEELYNRNAVASQQQGLDVEQESYQLYENYLRDSGKAGYLNQLKSKSDYELKNEEEPKEATAKLFSESIQFHAKYLNGKIDEAIENKPEVEKKVKALNKLSQQFKGIDQSTVEGKEKAAQIAQQYQEIKEDPEVSEFLGYTQKLVNLVDKNKEVAKRFPKVYEDYERRKQRNQELEEVAFRGKFPHADLSDQLASQYMTGIAPVGRGIVELMSSIAKFPANIQDWDDKYDWQDQSVDFVDGIADYVNDNLFPQPASFSKPLFTTDNGISINEDLVVPKTIRTITDMATLLTGGGAVSKIPRALGVAKNASWGIGLFTSSMVNTHNDYLQHALEKQMNPSDAAAFALGASTLTSALEMVNPQGWIVNKGEVTEQVVKALATGQTKKGALREGAKFMLKDMGGEQAQEMLQLVGDKTAEYMANSFVQGEPFEENKNDLRAEVLETMVLTALATASVSSSGAARHGALYQESIRMVAEDTDKWMPLLQEELKNSDISSEQAKQIIDDIEQTKISLPKYTYQGKDITRQQAIEHIKAKDVDNLTIQNDEALGNALVELSEGKDPAIPQKVDRISLRGLKEATLQKDKKKVLETLDNAIKSIKQYDPNLKVAVTRNSKEYQNVTREITGNPELTIEELNGYYHKGSNTVVIHMPEAEGTTALHEITHPILEALIDKSPEIYSVFEDQIGNKTFRLDGQEISYKDLARRAGYNEAVADNEAITQYIADVALGRFEKVNDPSFWGATRRFFEEVLEFVGVRPKDINVNLETVEGLEDFAGQLAEGFSKGKTVRLYKPDLQRKQQVPISGEIYNTEGVDVPVKRGEPVTPEQLGIAADRFKPKNFYSPSLKVLESLPQNKATSDQWKSMLMKNGAKQAELEWMGIDEFLKENPKPTKEQLQKFMEENQVEVQEVTKSGEDPGLPKEFERANLEKNLNENPEKYRDLMNEYDNNVDDIIDAYLSGNLSFEREDNISLMNIDAWDNLSDSDKSNYGVNITPTQYDGQQLPGGENYTELLLTMPQESEKTFSNLEEALEYEKEIIKEGLNPTLISNLDGTHTVEVKRKRKDTFKSSHFDEPNILAHVRFNERTDSEGNRVLFLEEVQSDWAQKGRKRGWEGELGHDNYRIDETPEGRFKVFNNEEGSYIQGLYGDASYKSREIAEGVINKRRKNGKAGAVPNMPFKNTSEWVGLALKRMVLYASENGFDRIAWTTGEQQAERYDLSKQIDELQYVVLPSGNYRLIGSKNDEGILHQDEIPEDQIENYVGKELAKKIINREGEQPKYLQGNKSWTLSGFDLKVGGEGMNAFYNNILPSTAKKVLSKIDKGVRVEPIGIPIEGEVSQQLGITLSEKLKSQEEMPMFQRKLSETAKRIAAEKKSLQEGVQREIATDPKRFETERMSLKNTGEAYGRSVHEVINEMTPADPHSAKVGLEKYQELVAKKSWDDATAVFEKLIELFSVGGQLVRIARELKTASPDLHYEIYKGMVEKQGVTLTENAAKKLKEMSRELTGLQNDLSDLKDKFLEHPSEELNQQLTELEETLKDRSKKMEHFANSQIPKGVVNTLSSILKGDLLVTKSFAINVTSNALWRSYLIGQGLISDIYMSVFGKHTFNPLKVWAHANVRGWKQGAVATPEGFKDAFKGDHLESNQKIDVPQTLQPGTAIQQLTGLLPKEFDKIKQLVGTKDLPVVKQDKNKVAQKMFKKPFKELNDTQKKKVKANLDKVPLKIVFEKILEASPQAMYAETSFRALHVGDKPFRSASREAATFRKAIDLGIKGDAEYLNFRYNMPDDVKEEIEQEAQSATFSDKRLLGNLVNFIGSTMANYMDKGTEKVKENSHPFFGYMASVMAGAGKMFGVLNSPYVRVPSNLTQLSAELFFWPVNLIGVARHWGTRKAGTFLSRAIAGYMLNQALSSMYDVGLFVAPADEDDESERALKHGMAAPGSFNISGFNRWWWGLGDGDPTYRPGEDTAVDFQWLGVPGMMMAFYSGYRENLEREYGAGSFEELDWSKKAGAYWQGGFKGILDMPFLHGISNTINLLAGEGGWQRYLAGLGNTASNIVVPNQWSAATRANREYVVQAKDADALQLFKEHMEVRGVWDFDDTEALPVLNIFGERVKQNPEGNNPWVYQMLDVRKPQKIGGDPRFVYLWEIYKETGEIPYRMPNNQVTISIGNLASKTLKLTEADYKKAVILAGKDKNLRLQQLMSQDQGNVKERLIEFYKKDAEKFKKQLMGETNIPFDVKNPIASVIAAQNNQANKMALMQMRLELQKKAKEGKIIIDEHTGEYEYKNPEEGKLKFKN